MVIGNNLNEVTDNDFIKGSDGKPFIPGTALAGVLRNYLSSGLKENAEPPEVNQLFGKRSFFIQQHLEDSMLSKIYVYDAFLLNEAKVRIRDGVALSEWKTALDKTKYDYEILEPGAEFFLKFEVVFRDGDHRNRLKAYLYEMVEALRMEKVSFGAKVKRGMGKGQFDDIKVASFDFTKAEKKKDILNQWLEFEWNNFKCNIDYTGWKRSEIKVGKKEVRLSIPLQNKYSLLIRQSAFGMDEPDFVQLHNSDSPIIPGTTWAGAVKHRAQSILRQLGVFSDDLLQNLFGWVLEDSSRASRIIFEESVVEDGMSITQTRVKIDRFTGGAVESALFDAKPVYEGKTKLSIRIIEPRDYEIGLMLLIIKDLQEGFLSVGGEVSIGRGIFEGKEVQIENEKGLYDISESDVQYYYSQLAVCIQNSKKGELLDVPNK